MKNIDEICAIIHLEGIRDRGRLEYDLIYAGEVKQSKDGDVLSLDYQEYENY